MPRLCTISPAGEELRQLFAEAENGFVSDRYQTEGADSKVLIDGSFDLDFIALQFTQWLRENP